MSQFVKLIINRNRKIFRNIKYLPSVIHLYERFSKYLNDDYFNLSIDGLIDLIEKNGNYFWVILDERTKKFTGFVFLDNWTGEKNNPHSAEVTTCFEPEYWGDYTKICARQFIKYCFKKDKLKKLKACIFPQNSRVKNILKRSGFKREALL